MKIKLFPSIIAGTIAAPPSKSSMQRALAAALLHDGITHIHNPGNSNDDLAALSIIKQLGARVKESEKMLIVTSKGKGNNIPPNTIINCGESGLSARMFAPIAALFSSEIILEGKGTLAARPMDFFENVFPQLNIKYSVAAGKLPLKIQGPLIPANLEIDGSMSSQYLTGLLFALSAAATKPVTVTVNNLKSKPYIELTIAVMKVFGRRVENNNYKSFVIHPFTEKKDDIIEYTVEGDWSSASFLLVAGAVAGRVTLTGLDKNSAQADKAILKVLKLCGAEVKTYRNSVTVSKKELWPFRWDAANCPDLFPPLVALAAYCNGTSVIKGISRLQHKESDRGKTLQQIFSAMGIDVLLRDDDMIINGDTIKAADVSSHNDHRIAMAAAVAALGASGDISIEDAEAVNKSYPRFFTDIAVLGAKISEP